MFTKSLITGEAAQRFIQMMGTDTGRNAHLGNAETMESGAKPFVLSAHIAIRDGIAKVQALVDDKTRSEPEKHAAARKVANQTCEAVTKAQENLKKHGETLTNDAMNSINAFFRNSAASDPGIRSDIRAWIKETMKTETGTATVRMEAEKDPRVAAELYEAPTFLTGVTQRFRDDVTTDVMLKRAPEVADRLTAGVEIAKLANGYDKIAREIHPHFYNPMLADQAATRVEV